MRLCRPKEGGQLTNNGRVKTSSAYQLQVLRRRGLSAIQGGRCHSLMVAHPRENPRSGIHLFGGGFFEPTYQGLMERERVR